MNERSIGRKLPGIHIEISAVCTLGFYYACLYARRHNIYFQMQKRMKLKK
jgi:hypothetical protein